MMSRRVAGDRRSRSTCSDPSAVPKVVQTGLVLARAPTATVENGASGLRRKMRATSAAGGLTVRPDLVERDEQVRVASAGHAARSPGTRRSGARYG